MSTFHGSDWFSRSNEPRNSMGLLGYSVSSHTAADCELSTDLFTGPLPDTVADMWKMIESTKSTVIVMLTNPVERGRVSLISSLIRLFPIGCIYCIKALSSATVTLVSLSAQDKGWSNLTSPLTAKNYNTDYTNCIRENCLEFNLKPHYRLSPRRLCNPIDPGWFCRIVSYGMLRMG